jgi:hypothetical protein
VSAPLQFNIAFPIVDEQGRPTTAFHRALTQFVQDSVAAAIAAAAAQATAQTAVTAAATAQDAAEAAAADAASRQPASTSLTNLAALSGTGLVEQTGANAFTNRLIGATNASDIPTRSDADARYVRRDQASAPIYSTYAGQSISNPPTQAQCQATDDAVKAASAALASLIGKTQTVHLLT